jgi:hypothetical protein
VRSGRDHEGNLPTGIFKQLFISHAGSYAIVNPGKSKQAAQEIAAVIPMER